MRFCSRTAGPYSLGSCKHNQLRKWTKEWGILVNSGNWEVIHFGNLNLVRTCTVNGRAFESVIGKETFSGNYVLESKGTNIIP